MSAFIDELKGEHLAISDCLLKAVQVGIESKQGKGLIISAKQRLLDHLAKEDKLLYPTLRKAAKNDPKIQKIYDRYAREMEEISESVLVFFTLYESEQSNNDNFQSDCNNIINALSKRIAREEAVLYKIYDDANSGKA